MNFVSPQIRWRNRWTLCERIFAEVWEYARDKDIPLGVNVESVSIRKTEIEASVELLRLLRRRIDESEFDWRRRPDLNRGWRFCRPLPYHLATAPTGNSLVTEAEADCGLDVS